LVLRWGLLAMTQQQQQQQQQEKEMVKSQLQS
jgi:hypothetical protein